MSMMDVPRQSELQNLPSEDSECFNIYLEQTL